MKTLDLSAVESEGAQIGTQWEHIRELIAACVEPGLRSTLPDQ
jgi:hypothetical protein